MPRRSHVPWSFASLALVALVPVLAGLAGCAGGTRSVTVEEAMDTTPLPVAAEDPTTHQWGFRGPDGAWVLPPVYHQVLEFSPGGIAAVADASGWRFVDRSGQTQIAHPWMVDNYPDPFQEGLARAVEEQGFLFFDDRGRVVLRTAYSYAEPFSGGLALVCTGCLPERVGEQLHWIGGRWGFIDRQGREVIPCRYDDATSFDEGVARVKLGGEWLTIDPSGRTVAD